LPNGNKLQLCEDVALVYSDESKREENNGDEEDGGLCHHQKQELKAKPRHPVDRQVNGDRLPLRMRSPADDLVLVRLMNKFRPHSPQERSRGWSQLTSLPP
jgi:hypothetical protein